MAHVGQKVGLGLGCLFRSFLRHARHLLGSFHVRDVQQPAQDGVFTLVVGQHIGGQIVARLTGSVEHLQLDAAHTAFGKKLAANACAHRGVHIQRGYETAFDHVEHAFHGRVGQARYPVDRDSDAQRAGFQDVAQLGFLLAQILHGLIALSDVTRGVVEHATTVKFQRKAAHFHCKFN